MSDYDNLKYDVLFTSVQSGAIRTLFEALKEVLVDVNITFDEEGIKIAALDHARVALVHLKLVSESFVHYSCKKPCKIGVPLGHLFKLIKLSGNSDVITMYVNEGRLHIIMENKEKNTKIESELVTIDIDDVDIDIPDVDFDAVITMPSSDFQKICRDLSSISDTLIIKSEGKIFTLKAEGEIGSTSIMLGGSDSENQNKNGVVFNKDIGIIEEKFNIKYLNLFTKSTSLCSQIELYLKEKYPIVLLYSVANLGSLKYLLSPKKDIDQGF